MLWVFPGKIPLARLLLFIGLVYLEEETMKKRSKTVAIMREHPWVRLLFLVATFVLMLVVGGMVGCSDGVKKTAGVEESATVEELLSEGAERPTDVFDVIEVPEQGAGPSEGAPAAELQLQIGRFDLHHSTLLKTKGYKLKPIDKWLGQFNFCKLQSESTYEFLGTVRSFPPSPSIPQKTEVHASCEYSLGENDVLDDAIQWRDIGYLDTAMIKHARTQIASLGMTPQETEFPTAILRSLDDIADVALSVKSGDPGAYVYLVGKTFFPAHISNTYVSRPYGFMAAVKKDLDISQAKVAMAARDPMSIDPEPTYYEQTDLHAVTAFSMDGNRNGVCAAGSVREHGEKSSRVLVHCRQFQLTDAMLGNPAEYTQYLTPDGAWSGELNAIAHYETEDNKGYMVAGGGAATNTALKDAAGEFLQIPYLVVLEYSPLNKITKLSEISLENVRGAVNDITIVGDYAIAAGWGESPATGDNLAVLWIVDLSNKFNPKKVYLESTFGGKHSTANVVRALKLPGGQFRIAVGGSNGRGSDMDPRLWQFKVDLLESGNFVRRKLTTLSNVPINGYVVDLRIDPDTLAVYALFEGRVTDSMLARIVTVNDVPRLDGTFAEGGERILIGCNGTSRMGSMIMFENGDILAAGRCKKTSDKKKELGLIKVYELK